MAIYSIDVRVYATAYIRADSAEEAEKVARATFGDQAAKKQGGGGDYLIDYAGGDGWEVYAGSSYLPDDCDVALSPSISFHGPDVGDGAAFVDDDDDGEDTETERLESRQDVQTVEELPHGFRVVDDVGATFTGTFDEVSAWLDRGLG